MTRQKRLFRRKGVSLEEWKDRRFLVRRKRKEQQLRLFNRQELSESVRLNSYCNAKQRRLKR